MFLRTVQIIKNINNRVGYLLICGIILPAIFLAACTNPESVAEDNKKEITDGKVVAISDGDTFRLLTDKKQTVRVRLHGIDAPEKGQDFSTQSRQVLSELVFGKEVSLEQRDKDRYGRVVAVVYSNGLNVNEEMLRRGMVWHYKEYDKTEAWAELEQKARSNKTGLWQQPSPTPPWQFRKEKRTAKEAQKVLAE
jgi:endonuclease YncB( thermonuclease family)